MTNCINISLLHETNMIIYNLMSKDDNFFNTYFHNMHDNLFVKENDLRNLLQKKKMEKEERYRTTEYKHHQKKDMVDDSRDTHLKLKKREEEERDSRRSHRERDQYIEQYYKMLPSRKFFLNVIFNTCVLVINSVIDIIANFIFFFIH